MPPPVIVCEKSRQWAVTLGMELASAGLRIRQTRSLADCRAEIDASPTSFVVLELTAANAHPMLTQIARSTGRYPHLRVAVLADRSLGALEWPVREAGAVFFATTPRRVEMLARMVVRHSAAAPPPERTCEEEIRACLPWGE
jgi:hypothetical protein